MEQAWVANNDFGGRLVQTEKLFANRHGLVWVLFVREVTQSGKLYHLTTCDVVLKMGGLRRRN